MLYHLSLYIWTALRPGLTSVSGLVHPVRTLFDVIGWDPGGTGSSSGGGGSFPPLGRYVFYRYQLPCLLRSGGRYTPGAPPDVGIQPTPVPYRLVRAVAQFHLLFCCVVRVISRRCTLYLFCVFSFHEVIARVHKAVTRRCSRNAPLLSFTFSSFVLFDSYPVVARCTFFVFFRSMW